MFLLKIEINIHELVIVIFLIHIAKLVELADHH